MHTSVIVPCFNEEQSLLETNRRLNDVMSKTSDNFEIIYINDGSSDRTLQILTEIASTNSHVKVISLSRNFGHQAAVSAGLKLCSGDIAVIIDADLQDPPELIPEMIRLHKTESANVVYAVRKNRSGESLFKLVTAKYFYRLMNWMSEVSFPNDTGDFRLIDRAIINEFNKLKENNKYIRGLISWMGFKQVPIYFDRDVRFAGETKYTIRKMLKFASTSLLYFSKKPLLIASLIGTLSIILGVIYLFTNLFLFMSGKGDYVSGWTSTIGLIIFFGGVQLLTIGVMGQYIGVLFDELKGRPEFIVESKINFDK